MENFNNYKFRSSAVGNIMPTAKATTKCPYHFDDKKPLKKDYKGDEEGYNSALRRFSKMKECFDNNVEDWKREQKDCLSEGAKTYIRKLWIYEMFGKKKEISNKYCSKGTIVEDLSITLYSTVSRNFFKKNEEHFSNDYVMGTPDIIAEKQGVIKDIKSCWDIFTFYDKQNESLSSIYKYQLQAYMWMLGYKKSSLVYCLVDTPGYLINIEKDKLKYSEKYRGIENVLEDPNYLEDCEQIDKNMTFGDIHRKAKVFELEHNYNEELESKMISKIQKAREYMNELTANFYKKLK